jgi:hypothetical protein
LPGEDLLAFARQIIETDKLAKLDSFLQESTQPVHKRSGSMTDFKCPEPGIFLTAASILAEWGT